MMVTTVMGCSGSGVIVGEEVVKSPTRATDEVYEGSKLATVALVARNSDEEVVPYCTGVWISVDEIVTAAHCVALDEMGIISPVGEYIHYIIEKEVRGIFKEPAAIHLSKVILFDSKRDVAVLRAVMAGVPVHGVAELGKELPGIGERVYMVGHPRGLYWTFSNGVVSAYRVDEEMGPMIQVNGTVWYGNSGGGLFDREGKLIGIASQLTGVPNMAYFVHLDSIKSVWLGQ